MDVNYESEILNRLVDRYENSKAMRSGVFSRRIMLSVQTQSWLQARLEQPDEKKVYLDTLQALKAEGLIDYSWVKHEEGNLVDRIWLASDEEAVRRCYRRIGRKPSSVLAEELSLLIEEYLDELPEESELAACLRECREEMAEKRKIHRLFSDDMTLNRDILRCLVYLENNRGEQLERLMSTALYGDSKRFERSIRPKVLSILRHCRVSEGDDELLDDELLMEKGIVRWPEVFEFTGDLSIILDNGTRIDYAGQRYGAYINTETVRHIATVRAGSIRTVLFIENKANYVWYISHMSKAGDTADGRADVDHAGIACRKEGDTLVLYHGGCYSPMKGKWFRMVYQSLPGAEYYHWSDIDIGGFRIFHRLRKNIIPGLRPYHMDAATLISCAADAAAISSDDYLRRLEKLRQDPEYLLFYEVIDEMRTRRIRLEQEMEIV